MDVSQHQALDADKVNQAPIAPPPVVDPWPTTSLLLRLRWRMMRSPWVKVAVAGLAAIMFFAVISAVNIGYVLQLAAQMPQETASSVYARTWISTLESGGVGSLGAAALGGAVAVAVFAPFTGASTLSLVSVDDLVGLRPRRGHRFHDALLINGLSGIGLLQLLALTVVASILTLDGQRLWAMLLSWSMWIALIALTTVLGFVVEFAQRRYGPTVRRAGAAALTAVVVVAVSLDENRGQTLFGLSEHYTTLMRASVESFTAVSAVAVAVVVAVAAGLVWVGPHVAERALMPAPRRSNGSSSRLPVPMGEGAVTIAVSLLARVLWRTKESRRPIVAIVVMGLPLVMFVDMGQALSVALPMTVPLAVSLSWGVNLFGVLGRGMSWIGSQPRLLDVLPRVAVTVQASLSFLVLVALWTVSWLSGRSTAADSRPVLVASLTAAAATSAVSLMLTVTRPMRATLSGAGDALVPPVTALAYLALLVVVGGLPGVVIAEAENAMVQAAAVAVVLAFSSVVVWWALRLWHDPRRRARAIAAVSSD